MARVSIVQVDEAPKVEGPADVESRALFADERDPIHLKAHKLAAGAGLTIAGDPADVALFVWRGSIEAGGAKLAEKASAIVERGTSLMLTGGEGGATVLAFSLAAGGGNAGGHVHLLPSEQVPRTQGMGGNEGIGGAIHADSGCPTCTVWLHENSYAMADKETALHSHSEDEVIFVHTGSIRLGNRVYGAGTALVHRGAYQIRLPLGAGRARLRQFPGNFADVHFGGWLGSDGRSGVVARAAGAAGVSGGGLLGPTADPARDCAARRSPRSPPRRHRRVSSRSSPGASRS